jgi:hypothetical protein
MNVAFVCISMLMIQLSVGLSGNHDFVSRGVVAASERRICEVSNRDKTGTSSLPENGHGSQLAKNKPNASRGSFEAEGTGFEPATPCGALHFQCSRWPIRLPSEVATKHLSYQHLRRLQRPLSLACFPHWYLNWYLWPPAVGSLHRRPIASRRTASWC